MAQTGTQDILKAIPTYDTPFLQPLAPSSAQTSSEMRLNTETAHISEGKSEEMRQKSPAVLIKPSGDSDDEVQLIFCAPRRKKRKKKRLGSLQSLTAGGGDHQTSLKRPPTDANSIGWLRRGTTGMVKGLEAFHLEDGVKILNSSRGDSLPPVSFSGPPNMNQQISPFNTSNASMQFFPLSPLSMSTNWSSDHNTSTLVAESENMQPSQTRQLSIHPLMFSESGIPIPPFTGMHGEHADLFGNSSMNPSLSGSSNLFSAAKTLNGLSSSAAAPMDTMGSLRGKWGNQCSPLKSNSHVCNVSATTESHDDSSWVSLVSNLSEFVGDSHPRHSEKLSPWEKWGNQYGSKSNPRIDNLYGPGLSHQQMIGVPAAFVPDQSVSPRTRTVEVARPPTFYQTEQARQNDSVPMELDDPTSNVGSRIHSQKAADIGTNLLQASQSQSQNPSSISSHSSAAPSDSHREPSQAHDTSNTRTEYSKPAQTHRQTPQPANTEVASTRQFDVHRKPSLYAIPQWPSSLLPTTSQMSPSVSRAQASTSSNIDGRPEPMIVNSVEDRTNHSISSRSLPSQSPEQPKRQSKSRSRTHSPNLIVDIAETAQANFPFAEVAARHSVPQQKVFDTWSAIIQLPLLCCATDKRRHGILAKDRMREFREAKRAMERAEQVGSKRKRNAEASTSLESMDENGRVEKRGRRRSKGKQKDLYKAAILNNATRGG